MKILLVGAGGYGSLYVHQLLEHSAEHNVVWEGIVDPYFDACADKEKILQAGIPVYDTMEAFYNAHTADLAVICTPPFLHCKQSLCALEHGSYVLCEKPLAPTPEEAELMRAAEKKHNKFIAIGYQWSFSAAIRALKEDVLSGKLGAPVLLKTLVCWPRNRAYYARGTGWGGKISRDGVMILDSVASNACAHYVHNMLFLLGKDMESAAEAAKVTGDCLRANDIENFDTCTLRIQTTVGDTLYFAASHATEKVREPEFIYRFENAEVRFSEAEGSQITAYFKNGEVKTYGNPFADTFRKLWDCVAAIRSEETPICTVKTATPHTKLINMIYRTLPIQAFPADQILENDNNGLFVKNLFENICTAYDRGALLSEIK